MKSADKSGRVDERGCMITGAKNGSTKVGTRIVSNRVTGADEHDGRYRSNKGGDCV